MSRVNSWQHFDVDERDPDESRLRKWLPIGGAAALVLVLGGGAAALVQMMSGTAAPQQPLVQQISIILPPPPPPPPEMKQPEPEEVKLDEPKPESLADESSQDPGEELGLDTDGVAGGDAFGLLAKKGGRGLLGNGSPYAWYAGVLQRDLQAALSDDQKIRELGEYAVVVSIRLSPDGYIQESRLLSGSNNPKLDAALSHALSAGVRISREPPEDLPQPIRLRISSRG